MAPDATYKNDGKVMRNAGIERAHWTMLAVAAALGAVAPVGADIALVAGSSAIARVVAIILFGVIGAFCASKVGLSASATRLDHPVLVPLAVAAAVAAWVVLIDCGMFRHSLPPHYIDIFRNIPLGMRLFLFMSRAYVENLIYRLFLMSVLVWLLGRLWQAHSGLPANGTYWAAMIASQVLNIGFNVLAQNRPVSADSLLYAALRYVVPGVIWGYLYWRHGFATAEIASVGTHPFLQPPLGYFLG